MTSGAGARAGKLPSEALDQSSAEPRLKADEFRRIAALMYERFGIDLRTVARRLRPPPGRERSCARADFLAMARSTFEHVPGGPEG